MGENIHLLHGHMYAQSCTTLAMCKPPKVIQLFHRSRIFTMLRWIHLRRIQTGVHAVLHHDHRCPHPVIFLRRSSGLSPRKPRTVSGVTVHGIIQCAPPPQGLARYLQQARVSSAEPVRDYLFVYTSACASHPYD